MSKYLHQLAVTGVAFAALAGAFQVQAQAQSPNNVSIGAGVVFAPRYPGSGALEALSIPMLNITHELAPHHIAYLQGLGGGYAYEATDKLTVGLHARYRGERDNDEAELYGMPKVDGTLEIGPRATYQINDTYGVEGQLLWDAGNAYDGYTARVGGTYKRPLAANLLFNAGAGVNYGDDKYTNAYYGVPAYAARNGRPAYNAGSGITHLDAKASLTYLLNAKWSVTGGLGADYLVGDAADSPLVSQELQPGLLLGISYRF